VQSYERKRKMYIDHDHKTGKVRGILCPRDNTLLGLIQDNPEILKNVLKYLKT